MSRDSSPYREVGLTGNYVRHQPRSVDSTEKPFSDTGAKLGHSWELFGREVRCRNCARPHFIAAGVMCPNKIRRQARRK